MLKKQTKGVQIIKRQPIAALLAPLLPHFRREISISGFFVFISATSANQLMRLRSKKKLDILDLLYETYHLL